MFGIGGFELFVILLFGFLIFGPDKLPALAKTLGKAISKFRNAQSEMTTVIKNEVYDPNSDEPFKNPVDAIEKATEAGKRAAGIKTHSNGSKTSTENSSAQKTESAAENKPHVSAKQESFLERKARYEREQAKKAEAEKKAQAQSIASQSENAGSGNSSNKASASKSSSSANTSSAQKNESCGE